MRFSLVYHTVTAGAGLQAAMAAAAAGPSRPTSRLGSITSLASIEKKLTTAIVGGKETEVDRQLAALSRQKQRVDLPMTPEVRLAAIRQRETIRPAKETCPAGHKVPTAQAKKQLITQDVYVCSAKLADGTECGALCGGADVHPLHLEIRMLSHADKNKYIDSVRWLSRSEVDVQTREYIQGHPLVFPHLAEGVLMNDETDAWMGWVLGWNVYFWHGNVQEYWTKKRRELEARRGADGSASDDSETEARGRGKRRKRKLAIEEEREATSAKIPGGMDDEFESLPPELQAEVDREAANARQEKKSKKEEPPAAAADAAPAASSTAEPAARLATSTEAAPAAAATTENTSGDAAQPIELD